MGVNYKLGADVGSFKQGMQEAQASLRTLDAALKANESSLKAGGNAQLYMEQKTRLLNDKMQQQKKMADQLQDAMKKMRENGVSPTSVEYQRLHQQLLQAQAGMNDAKVAMDNLTASEEKASNEASQLATNVSSIGKKVNLDAVIGGIGKITDALKSAAGMAVQLGEKLWDNIMNTARISDDYATMASMYGIDVETLQKQLKVFDTMADTSIEAYYKARMKINSAINNPSDEQINILSALGFAVRTGKFEEPEQVGILVENAEDALWEVGKKIKEDVENGKISRDTADLWMTALFGRGFTELNPLLEKGKEEFEKAVNEQSAATKEAVENNAALADSVALVEKNFETFKIEVLGGIAPELTKVADSASTLINRFTEYAQSEDGQKLIKSLGDTVADLFSDLTKIDPEKAVETFTDAFTKLREGLEWVSNNWEGVESGLKAIGIAFGTLKVAETVLTFVQLLSSGKFLFNWGGSNNAESTSAAVNTAKNVLNGSGTAANATAVKTGAKTLLGAKIQQIGEKAMVESARRGFGQQVMDILQAAIPGGSMATSLMNMGAVGDWFTNVTPLGQAIRDNGLSGGVDFVKNYITKDLPSNIADWYKQSYWDEVVNYYTDSVQTTAKMVKDGVIQLGDVAKEVIVDPVADFIEQTAKDIQNLPEAVEQVTNATPEQNRNALRTLIDTFLNGMQEGGGGSHGFDIPVTPELEDDSAEKLQEEASKIVVQIGARIVPVSFSGGGGGGGGGKFGELMFHANGIWSVPFDGYPAILHRGEQVVPAREVSSRSYNSNLYVEKMIMNNGTDAEGLASAMAAAQRRRMSGYGS